MTAAALPQSILDALPAVRQSLGGPDNLVVVDASRATPAMSVAYFRSWQKDGMRVLPMSSDWRDADGLLAENTKLLIVLRQGRALSEQLRELINSLDVNRYRVLGIDAEMLLLQTINPLPELIDQRYAAAARTTLEVTGAESETFDRITFPMEFRISSRHADRFSALFAITAGGPDLPPSQSTWFRLDPGFEGILSIDREVGLRGDAWRLEVRSEDSGPVRKLIQAQPLPNAEIRPLDALAVVLDRTCPDNASWEQAFNLTNGKVDPIDFLREGRASPPETYNGEVRKGLADGLKAALEDNLVREVQPWWVKDIPGDGMENFVPMSLEGQTCGSMRTLRSARDCEDMYATAGYSPGLDLWDPLDVGLRQALRALGGTATSRRAILIVGNSPPSDPTQDHSPLRSLAMPPGAVTRCTVRHESPHWHNALAQCQKLQIPVLYLFLRHTAFGSVRPNITELYEQSQRRVENALAQTIGLETAVAEFRSVRDAIVSAIGKLRAEASLTSRVTLEWVKVSSDEAR